MFCRSSNAMGKKRKVPVEEVDESSETSGSEESEQDSDDSSGPDQSDEASSSSQSEFDTDDGSESDQIVNVDFEFFDPKPTDYHGVKALLNVYLDDTDWDVGGLVDLVLSQTTVGTVIKTSDEDTPIGLLTALNLGRYAGSAAVKQVQDFLMRHSSGRRELLDMRDAEVGLIVSERLVNVPIDLVQPLHDGLFDEVAWATEDEPTPELRESFRFKQYLILTRVFQEAGPKSSGTGNGKPEKKSKKVQENGHGQGSDAALEKDLIYIKPEDEIFHALSSWSFKFPVQAESLASRQSKGMRQWRLVMAVAASKIPLFRSRLKELVDGA